MEILTEALSVVPEFAFALVMFYLCQSNADKQRSAYQDQITALYAMMQTMIATTANVVELIRRDLEKLA